VFALRLTASFLFVICVPVAFATSTIRLLANEPRVYSYAIDHYDATAVTGIERAELIRGGAELRGYFNNGDDKVDIRVKQNDLDTPLFNDRETLHLKEVKARFHAQNIAQEFSVLYIIAYIAVVVLWAGEVTVRALAVQTMAGCALTLAIVGAVGAFSLGGFDQAWFKFHELIFSSDFWKLNPRTDHLIQMFPPAFWQFIVSTVGLLTAAEAGLVFVFSGLYLGVTGRQHAPVALPEPAASVSS
jgi:integral membrane protein (TIGR01906 family)